MGRHNWWAARIARPPMVTTPPPGSHSPLRVPNQEDAGNQACTLCSRSKGQATSHAALRLRAPL
eukprot:6370872-Prymnesium_polylepis.1